MIFVTTFVQDYQTLVACSNSEHTQVVIIVTTLVQDYHTLVACSNSEHTLVVIIVTTLVNLFLLLVVVAAARLSSHCKKDIAQVSSRMSSSNSTGFCVFNEFLCLINVNLLNYCQMNKTIYCITVFHIIYNEFI